MMKITLDNGTLFAQLTGQRTVPVDPESEAKFFYRVTNRGLGA